MSQGHDPGLPQVVGTQCPGPSLLPPTSQELNSGTRAWEARVPSVSCWLFFNAIHTLHKQWGLFYSLRTAYKYHDADTLLNSLTDKTEET